MKTILGLDIGNGIGWALIEVDEQNNPIKIVDMGSRIIPIGAELSKFEQGQAQTKNANRRIARGIRKLNKRYKQRRNKLIYILQQLNMLPSQIILSESFNDPNKIDRVSILPIANKQKQLTAFDLVQLRVQALNEKIDLKNLGKIIYLFNQLRGYSGGSAEPEKENTEEDNNEEEKSNKKQSFISFGKITTISEPETIAYKNKLQKKFRVSFETEDGTFEGDTFLEILKLNESLELQINISKSKKGESIFFKLPNKTNWRKKMENLEKELNEKSKIAGREIYLSEHFLDVLKENKWARIRNNVVLRSRYKSEFDAIWSKQYEKNPDFKSLVDDKVLLEKIISFIFPGRPENKPPTTESLESKKEKYRIDAKQFGLKYLIRDQIVYYQRDLQDQSKLISLCRFEKPSSPIDKNDPNYYQLIKPFQVVAKSHPIFQEYKVWEQINKLTINTKTENGKNKKGEIKYKYVDKPIPIKLKEWLFDELQTKKEIGFPTILNKLKKEYQLRDKIDFLNGMNPKAKLRGNETKLTLQKSLSNLWNILRLDNIETQIELWDILYNGKGNEYELNSDRTSKVLSFLKKHDSNIPDIDKVAIQISKIKFSRNYSELSLKAIEKILPLVRVGKYFNPTFSEQIHNKIVKLSNENVTDPFEKAAQEYLENNVEVLVEGGLMNAYATILVYDKHTAKEYSQDELINDYKQVRHLEQGELRNPLVEQLINETLAVVKDIWKTYTKPDEIHIELSRDLKNNAERRAKMYKSNRENQKANDEIKIMLIEIKEEISKANIEKYKIWLSQENLKEEYIKQYSDPSKSEIEKLKLWKEQGHVSPYTGQPIPLSELFDKSLYDVDHIIPQSRYFDDSLTNKLICETSVNRDKGNKTAMEYFEAGSLIPTVFGKADFIDHVNRLFNGLKRKNLLATKVPEDPVARQIKETQYVSIKVKEELNKIVGNGNVKTSTGGITDYLRNQWGLTDKFKNILRDRYEKIEPTLAEVEYNAYKKAIEEKKKEHEKSGLSFTEIVLDRDSFIEKFRLNYIKTKNNKLVIDGWTKRIDHRHHPIDALVVACTKEGHIKRLNDLNKELQNWIDKHKKEFLPDFEGSPSELLDEILTLDAEKQKRIFTQIKKFREIDKPWNGFPEDAEEKIKEIIVSHKPKDKLIIQNGKEGKLQIKIRGQLHEGTLYGKSNGIETYRIPLLKLAGKNSATEKTIAKISNIYLRQIIADHLKAYDSKKEEAFSTEGILNLNKKLASKTSKNGNLAPHTPISSIKVYYRDPEKIRKKKEQVETEDALQRLERSKAYNNSLYVSTGGNYLFAVMEKDRKRIFDIITFFDAVNYLKDEFNKVSDKSKFNKELVFKNYFEEKNKANLLFTLKQNDIVYFPDKDEDMILDKTSSLYNSYWSNKKERSKNVYVVQKFSGTQIYFINHTIADLIKRKIEFGSQDCYELIDGRSIKHYCLKLSVDRLGNIIPSKKNFYNEIKEQPKIISEPEVAYQKRTLKKFDSFEDMENDQLEYFASLTPQELLKNHKQLSMAAFGFKDDPETKKPDRKIKFD
jgi:CRISPR subtype II RNA-guided endonuclease Cas9/Csn1